MIKSIASTLLIAAASISVVMEPAKAARQGTWNPSDAPADTTGDTQGDRFMIDMDVDIAFPAEDAPDCGGKTECQGSVRMTAFVPPVDNGAPEKTVGAGSR